MMDWQEISALAVVAVTAVLLVRQEIKSRRRARTRACGGECGCSSDVLDRIKAEARSSLQEKPAARSLL